MNPTTLSTSLCSASIGPAPIDSTSLSPTRSSSTRQRSDRMVVASWFVAAGRTLARWLPAPSSLTPSARAISALSPGDRLGERR